jgi:hypothetical protein
MSDRSLIFNAKGDQVGYIEDNSAFDLTGRERCTYARATGNLYDLNGDKIVGHISAYPGYLISYLVNRVVKSIVTAL